MSNLALAAPHTLRSILNRLSSSRIPSINATADYKTATVLDVAAAFRQFDDRSIWNPVDEIKSADQQVADKWPDIWRWIVFFRTSFLTDPVYSSIRYAENNCLDAYMTYRNISWMTCSPHVVRIVQTTPGVITMMAKEWIIGPYRNLWWGEYTVPFANLLDGYDINGFPGFNDFDSPRFKAAMTPIFAVIGGVDGPANMTDFVIINHRHLKTCLDKAKLITDRKRGLSMDKSFPLFAALTFISHFSTNSMVFIEAMWATDGLPLLKEALGCLTRLHDHCIPFGEENDDIRTYVCNAINNTITIVRQLLYLCNGPYGAVQATSIGFITQIFRCARYPDVEIHPHMYQILSHCTVYHSFLRALKQVWPKWVALNKENVDPQWRELRAATGARIQAMEKWDAEEADSELRVERCSHPDCLKKDDLKRCSACKETRYCSAECQKSDRLSHRMQCDMVAAELKDTSRSHLSKRDRDFLFWITLVHGPAAHIDTFARIIAKEFPAVPPWKLIFIVDYTKYPEGVHVRKADLSPAGDNYYSPMDEKHYSEKARESHHDLSNRFLQPLHVVYKRGRYHPEAKLYLISQNNALLKVLFSRFSAKRREEGAGTNGIAEAMRFMMSVVTGQDVEADSPIMASLQMPGLNYST